MRASEWESLLPRQNRTWDEFDVTDLKAGVGDEDEDLDAEGFGYEEVGEDDERNGEEEDEAAEKAAGFDGDHHEVREWTAGYEERAVKVGGNGLRRWRLGAVAFCYRREAPSCCGHFLTRDDSLWMNGEWMLQLQREGWPRAEDAEF